MTFEQIIRPFVTRGVTPPVKDIGQGPVQVTPNVLLSVGTVGNPKAFGSSFSSTTTYYMDAKKKEDKSKAPRKTHDKKVYQNNDPSTGNFVTIQVADEVNVLGPNGQKEKWAFDNPNPP